MQTALDKIHSIGWDVPEPHLDNVFVASVLAKHYAAILTTDSVAVPDDEEEMIWRLFFAHSQDMQGFRADIFTGGWNESHNPHDPDFVGLRDRWRDGRSMILGLARLWQNEEAQSTLKQISNPRRPVEKKVAGIKPGLELLRGPAGNDATRVFADTLEELRGPMVSRKTNMMIRAYVQNAALLAEHGCSFRQYLRAVAPDLYLPSSEIVWAERLWRQAIMRDFYNVGPALASYLICDWLLWLWREGQIEWFESYKEDSVFLKAMTGRRLLPAAAAENFVLYCRTQRVPAEWIPSRWWTTAYSQLLPRILNEAIWLEMNASQQTTEGSPSSVSRIIPGITDKAEWPHRTWDLPPYKSQAFMSWVEGCGGLAVFRNSPAYQWALQRRLIVDDEWNPDVAELPGTLGWTQADEEIRIKNRVNAWLVMEQRAAYTGPDVILLRRLLGEAEYDDGDDADPYVFWPLLDRPEGEVVKPRLLSVEGKAYVPAFTSLSYMQQSIGEENPYRVKTPLSNVCRFLVTMFKDKTMPIGTVVLNPNTDALYMLTSPIISRLSGEPVLQEENLDPKNISSLMTPSQMIAPDLLESIRAALRAGGWSSVKAVIAVYADSRWSLFVGLWTEDKQQIENAWSVIDQIAGRDLPDWAIIALPDSNLQTLFEDFGEVL